MSLLGKNNKKKQFINFCLFLKEFLKLVLSFLHTPSCELELYNVNFEKRLIVVRKHYE